MRWQIPIVALLMAGLAVSCDQAPTAVEDSSSDVPGIAMSADGNNGAVRWIPDPECTVFDGDGNPSAGVLSWAAHTTKEGNYMIPKDAAEEEVPSIETVVAGFTPEVHGMGGLTIRPHVLVEDLSDEDVDRFDAVAIPACVGGGRG